MCWCCYRGVHPPAVVRNHQNKIIQRHCLSPGCWFHREILTFHPSARQSLALSCQRKSAVSSPSCCPPSEEQKKGKGCCASPKPGPPTASLLLRDGFYLLRDGFVLRKDTLSVPGVIYSRKNELHAGEACRELRNGAETSPSLPSLGSHPWGVPQLQEPRTVVAKPFRSSSLVFRSTQALGNTRAHLRVFQSSKCSL